VANVLLKFLLQNKRKLWSCTPVIVQHNPANLCADNIAHRGRQVVDDQQEGGDADTARIERIDGVNAYT